jgi:hypothetical protein
MSYAEHIAREMESKRLVRMARVQDVILRTASAGPRSELTAQEMLSKKPGMTVVAGVFLDEQQAMRAAYRVNSGRDPEWPATAYYAAWGFEGQATDPVPEKDPDGERRSVSDDRPGRWELLIGLRDQCPRDWEPLVREHGSRRKSPYGPLTGLTVTEPTKPRLRKPPKATEAANYATARDALTGNPTMVVLDAIFPALFPEEEVTEIVVDDNGEEYSQVVMDVETGNPVTRRRPLTAEERARAQNSAEKAAYGLNCGHRVKWPSETYYAYASPEVDTETGKPTGRHEVLVGLREYMPEGWREVVSRAGARRRSGEEPVGAEVDD